MISKRSTFISLIILFSFLIILNLNSNNSFNDADSYESFSKLKTFSSSVNGKPLSVTQHANVSNSFFPSSLPTNISFTLAQGWISTNITINYEGVASESNTVSNGDFASNRNGWTYQSNNPGELVDKGWTPPVASSNFSQVIVLPSLRLMACLSILSTVTFWPRIT